MSLIEKKIAHYTFIKNLYINGHFIKNLKKKNRLAQKPKKMRKKKRMTKKKNTKYMDLCLSSQKSKKEIVNQPPKQQKTNVLKIKKLKKKKTRNVYIVNSSILP